MRQRFPCVKASKARVCGERSADGCGVIGVRQSVHRRHASQPTPAMTTAMKMMLIIGSPFLGRRVTLGGVTPHAGWAVWGFMTHGRRRGRSGSWPRWRIHPPSFWCNRASASTVKSSIQRIPQRVMLGCRRPPVGAASRSSLTDRSAFDLFKGSLRFWRGIHRPLGPPCISRGWCDLVVCLVDVVCGCTHACLSCGWSRPVWIALADQPGGRCAGVTACLGLAGSSCGMTVAR
jgi:hypothetical protein